MSMVNPTPFYHDIVLYVEGDTDINFFGNLNRIKYKAKRLVEGFHRSNKINIINHITDRQDPYEYGVVDKDFDNPFSLKGRIFCTDTHDLETLLILNDPKIFFRIFKKHIDADIDNAKFMAYQIGIIKKALYNIRRLQKGKKGYFIPSKIPLSHQEFSRDHKIVLEDFCSYIEDNSDESRLNPNLLKKEQIVNKYYYYVSNCSKNIFNTDKEKILSMPDFWDIVNGHDLLRLLISINPDAYETFNPKYSDFEFRLIKAFDTKCYYATKLYRKMYDSGLLY